MTISVDQLNQTLNPSPTPMVNSAVESGVVDNRIELGLHGSRMQCNPNQALVWALCSAEKNTLHQTAHQLQSLDAFDHTGDTLKYVYDTVALFEQNSFLSLAQNEQVHYPIDLRQYSHFMSSRGGLYAFNQEKIKRIAHGMFYGLDTDHSGNLFALDYPHRTSSRWRESFSDASTAEGAAEALIRQFSISNGDLQSEQVLHQGLGNNSHQLAYRDGALYVVNTGEQCITKISKHGELSHIYPNDPANRTHFNSLAKRDRGWLLMQSKSSSKDWQSSVLVIDQNWQSVEKITLPAFRTHDLLQEDKTDQNRAPRLTHGADLSEAGFWYCHSHLNKIAHHPSGHEINLQQPHYGRANKVRGLTDTKNHWLVGHGRVRQSIHPSEKPHLASISFIDKHNEQQTHSLKVPELPCCLIKNPWYQYEL